MTGYERFTAAHGYCPIEAGLMGALADNECGHGRLPGDPTRPCGCWPTEHPLPARVTTIHRNHRRGVSVDGRDRLAA